MQKRLFSLKKTAECIKYYTSSSQRFKYIRNHTPLTEYQDLNPIKREHLPNTTKLHTDPQTGIKFLIQEGGFAGCADMGICLKLGTQDETLEQSGSTNYLKAFVHMKPSMQQLISNYQFLQQTGSFFDFHFDTSVSYAKCSFLEQDKDIMIDLLLDLVLQEKNMFEDNFQTQEHLGDINQLVRRTAFKGSGLGMPSQGSGNILSNRHFLSFQQKIVPQNMLISMANLNQADQLIKQILNRIKQKYPKFLTRKALPKVKSNYVGGLGKFNLLEPQFFTFALAFPSVSFKSPQMELFNILRVLMGSASSFSSGGPGKGMHSRCTKYLLNRVQCVQSASFINQHYEDYGIFGLTVSGPHETYNDIVKCTIHQFTKLRHLIHQDELNRAKNILISSLYTNTQRQSDRLEQMSRHIFTYDKVRLYEFEKKIRQVTAEEIEQTMINLMKQKPTFVYSGLQKYTSLAPNESTLLQMGRFSQ